MNVPHPEQKIFVSTRLMGSIAWQYWHRPRIVTHSASTAASSLPAFVPRDTPEDGE
ncbi:hypothetical protein [Sorangium sp. So ce861]|uniref:hypothetical protein n=1 Tax=Sorangium sp. So ce861 TaxID=3133323 RepID=UPI003F60A202